MVIIGQTSVVRTWFANEGIQSVNYTVGNQVNRLYSLGSTAVYASTIPAANTFNVTVYGGVSAAQSYETGCVRGNAVSVVPGYCVGSPLTPVPFSSTNTIVTSYSYQKEYQSHGVETWSCTAYMKYPGQLPANAYADDVPDTFAVGILEGTLAGDFGYQVLGTVAGAHMVEGVIVAGFTGNVQASTANSIGTYEQTWYGTFNSIGASLFKKSGMRVNANVTIANQPIYNTVR